jgi:hypothetical protein
MSQSAQQRPPTSRSLGDGLRRPSPLLLGFAPRLQGKVAAGDGSGPAAPASRPLDPAGYNRRRGLHRVADHVTIPSGGSRLGMSECLILPTISKPIPLDTAMLAPGGTGRSVGELALPGWRVDAQFRDCHDHTKRAVRGTAQPDAGGAWT